MSQELKDPNRPSSPVAYFGATCPFLDRIASEPNPAKHLIDTLLTILSSVVVRLPSAVLEKKREFLFELVVRVTQPPSNFETAGFYCLLGEKMRLLQVARTLESHGQNGDFPFPRCFSPFREELCFKYKYKVLFEYVMLERINDSNEDAKRLVELVKGIPWKINLISFNPHSGSFFRPTKDERMTEFRNMLAEAGCLVLLKRSRGMIRKPGSKQGSLFFGCGNWTTTRGASAALSKSLQDKMTAKESSVW